MSNYNLPTVLANSYKSTWKYMASAVAMLINSIPHTAFYGPWACAPRKLSLSWVSLASKSHKSWESISNVKAVAIAAPRQKPIRAGGHCVPTGRAFHVLTKQSLGFFPFWSQDRRTLPWKINFLTSPFARNYLIFPLPHTSDTWQVFL